MLSSRCASYVFGMGGVLACISPTPLHLLYVLAITSMPCCAICCRMSWGAVSLVDPACITIPVRDYVFHCADLHIRYARVTVGSQVLSLSHKSKPSKFYALSLRLGSLRLQAEAMPMQILCSQLQEPCTRAIQHNIVTHISKKLCALRPAIGRPQRAQRSKCGQRPHLLVINY